MDSVFAVIGLAFAALLAVAVAVACWERLRERSAERPAPVAPLPTAATVDVPLEPLSAAPPPQVAAEQAARQAALGQAKVRTAKPPATAPALAWADTRPIVAPDAQRRGDDQRAAPAAESPAGH